MEATEHLLVLKFSKVLTSFTGEWRAEVNSLSLY